MKHSYNTLLGACLFATLVTAASGAVVVQQTTVFQDNDAGGILDVSVNFDNPLNSNNILIASVYVDALPGALIADSATFGGFNADAFITNERVYSYVYNNSSIASGASFNFTNTGTPGVGVILYEVSGANYSTMNTITGSSTITTDTINELVISFAGRNNNASATVSGSSIFSDEDEFTTLMKGGGSIASASTNVATPGSQNISWVGSNMVGLVAYSFDEVIPEPSSLALLGLGGAGMLIRRRRS